MGNLAEGTPMACDHSLLYQARKFVTAENVHYVKTWIFCYETAVPDSACQKGYEELLRNFVAKKNLILAIRMEAKMAHDRGIELRQSATRLEKIRRSARR